ncbi:MAG: serine hydrolase, partial [Pseudomonadales bacterium]|nr:serine hydrolase [Pseudomonadales bacterium]
AMNGGVLADGTHVLPDGWMQASTTPSKGYDGYGYLWWLGPGDTYRASGIFGQLIFVDPADKLVIAMHSNADSASGGEYGKHEGPLIEAIRNAVADVEF